jgi:hypothetical protein
MNTILIVLIPLSNRFSDILNIVGKYNLNIVIVYIGCCRITSIISIFFLTRLVLFSFNPFIVPILSPSLILFYFHVVLIVCLRIAAIRL